MWNINSCLETIRVCIAKIEDGDYPVSKEDMTALIKQFQALDEELTAGGSLPRSWER